MTVEVKQPGVERCNEPAWDVENYSGNLYSLSFNGRGVHEIQNLYLSYIVDWQLTNEEENPTQLRLFFPEYGF